MSYCPVPERWIFCIYIIDIISKNASLFISLLRERNYHYNKDPVTVDKLTKLMMYGGLFCIMFLHSLFLWWVINIYLFSLYEIFLKNEQIVPLYIELKLYIIIFYFFVLEYRISFTLTNFESVISLYFLSPFFEVVKEFHRFRFIFQSTEPPFFSIFWSSGKKKTCQCLSTFKVQLQSSHITPKNYPFVNTLSTSQHKDRIKFQK